ncbi:uncharacterized protein [Periplaneta americana]|uniref:uncharacterized protein isoform X2 n=1 Tax=Periplaneta americana TaxID=6978 RepID=UPI0037E84BEE
MSTQAYYKDRLGFDPAEALNDGSAFDKSQHGYEENLCKFKGLWEFYIESIDERDAIQKKTFTKWVNKHLKKTYTCLHVCAGIANSGVPCCSPTVSVCQRSHACPLACACLSCLILH